MQGKNLVRHVSVTTIAILGLLAFGAVEQARASGFWDRHIVDGAARSDWLRNPLLIDTNCLFSNGANVNCSDLIPVTDWDEWVDFNFRCWNGRCSSNGEYWVVHHNNEPSSAHRDYDGASADSVANPHPNSGPPGQSLHVYGLGATDQVLRMGIQRESDNLNRVRMVVDHRDGAVQNNPLGRGGIPFLGFGADMRAGNGGPISPINSSGPWTYGVRLELRKELHEVDNSPQKQSLVTYLVQMNAVWDGTPRLVQFPVFTDGTSNGNGSFEIWKWNWPYSDSFYYPGAEVVSVDPDWLEGICSIPVPEFSGADWESKDVLIRTDEIFQCLDAHNAFSDPLPVDAELAGFFVVNEITGEGAFLRTSTKNWRVVSW